MQVVSEHHVYYIYKILKIGLIGNPKIASPQTVSHNISELQEYPVTLEIA